MWKEERASVGFLWHFLKHLLQTCPAQSGVQCPLGQAPGVSSPKQYGEVVSKEDPTSEQMYVTQGSAWHVASMQ